MMKNPLTIIILFMTFEYSNLQQLYDRQYNKPKYIDVHVPPK